MDILVNTVGVSVLHKHHQRPISPFGSFLNCTPRRISVTCASTAVTKTTTAAPHPPTLKHKRPQNVEGDLYVNHTCIDCDVCRWMAPETFIRVDGQSAVYKQPDSAEERTAALQALLSCPVGSIRTEKPPSDILQVHSTMPLSIDEKCLPGVYHCGYHSKKSYGAASYLIKHPKGNILVDSPSFKEKLASKIDELGGARYMFLSHRDNVADHDKWAKRLSCDRILHINEVQSHTADVEIKLEGQGPWSLNPDVDLIFTPGHTEGSVSLSYKPLKALFTGDHLAASHNGELTYFEKYNCGKTSAEHPSFSANGLSLDFASPSFKEKLASKIDELGGARYMFFSHRDDVADHDKWAKRLSCDRILHINEVQPHTADVEIKLEGQGPWSLNPDVDLIFTPGHTEGSVSLSCKPLKALFTGDHLAASHNGELTYFEKYNWCSVEKQVQNIRPFLQMDFLWILPGHGRRIKFENINEKNAAIEKLLSGVGLLQLV